MGLLGNYTALNSNVGKSIGSFSNSYERMKVSRVMAFYCGDAIVTDITDKSAFNNSYNSHYAWVLSPKAGGMGFSISGSSILSLPLIPQQPTQAFIGGHGFLEADIKGISYFAIALTGSGLFTADITADGNISINLIGISKR